MEGNANNWKSGEGRIEYPLLRERSRVRLLPAVCYRRSVSTLINAPICRHVRSIVDTDSEKAELTLNLDLSNISDRWHQRSTQIVAILSALSRHEYPSKAKLTKLRTI